MKTRVRKLDTGTDTRVAIDEAAECLSQGGLVVFPTETVYGVGASAANLEAVARLREVKQRSVAKPFTVHIGSRSDVHRFVPEIRGLGRRLIDKAWPGPLTLIFRVEQVQAAPVIRETSEEHISAMYHDGTIGIRCPDDATASQLLLRAGVPVVAASANRASAPAPVEAAEAIDALEGQVDLVLDAGRTRYARASTIARVNGNRYELLREGVLDERILRRLVQLNILLVCTGNTCRSPMAEGLLRRMIAERLGCPEETLAERGVQVSSAGVGALSTAGGPASPEAVRVLKDRGIDISGHRAQPLTVELINRADHIYTMTASHRQAVLDLVPTAADRVRTLSDEDIPDPIGADEATYARCAGSIEQALRLRLEEIAL